MQRVGVAEQMDLDGLLTSWTRTLRARNRSERTVHTYIASARKLTEFAAERGLDPTDRSTVEAFLADQADRVRPATVAFRYRSLQEWFKWLVEEDELQADPMARMKPPHVPEQPVPVLSPDQLRALLATCSGKDYTDRRDHAILRLFIDTGMRLAELAGLAVTDLDLDVDNVAVVLGKGRRLRACPFGRTTAQALDRYLRARARHPQAHLPALWLGERGKGAMTASGVAQVVKCRSSDAGIGHVHTHQFRHTYASAWLAAGGTEGDLMRLAGWRFRQLLTRYGAAAADERTREPTAASLPATAYDPSTSMPAPSSKSLWLSNVLVGLMHTRTG
jgi:site-specific recombinase XerD